MGKRVTVQFLAEQLVDLARRVERVERRLRRRRIGFEVKGEDAGVVPGDGFKQDPDEE